MNEPEAQAATCLKPRRDEKGRWLSGQSGNPGGKLGGRPPGSSMMAEIERQLEAEAPDGRSHQERIVSKLIELAEEGGLIGVKAADLLLRRVAPEKLAIHHGGDAGILLVRDFTGRYGGRVLAAAEDDPEGLEASQAEPLPPRLPEGVARDEPKAEQVEDKSPERERFVIHPDGTLEER